jgi:hypothetical protein
MGFGYQTLTFGARCIFSLFHNLISPAIGLINNFGRLLFRFFEIGGRLFLRQFQITLCPIRGTQALGNLLLTFLERPRNRRPNELHAEEHKQGKPNGLAN